MKKSKRMIRAVALSALTATLAGAVMPLAGCPSTKDNVIKENPEVRPLTMSIQTPDGVFNPFFSTSAYDSSILGMTQIGMLSSDQNGKVACGNNEPVVVKEYKITTLASDGKTETKKASEIAYTKYDFVLKNDIKFSDGTPLTIKDVLFNLYVYLDPLYTGSSTIYSTKIVGLEQYRKQDPNATSDSLSSFEEGFISDANIRIQELAEFIRAYGMYSPAVGETRPSKDDQRWDEPAEKQSYVEDYQLVASEFIKELNTDWNSTEGSMETYLKWGFTDVWQVYLMNDGQESDFLARYESGEKEGQLIKDDEGNYKMNVEYASDRELDLKDYLAEQGITATEGDVYKNAVKQWAIDSVYMSYFPEIENVDSQIAATNANNFVSILNAWATGQEIRTQFTARAKSDYYASHERVVPTISGVDGTKTVMVDGEEHEVLSITIHDIDPKAIWNFGFNVAPMHYYSGTFEGKDYVKAAMEKGEAQGEFGLKFGSKEFMDQVINAPSKIGLPVGGGSYMASSSAGTPAKNGDDFFDANMVYYQRNPYFYTLGGSDVESESELKNAKIKYVRYKVVNADQVLGSVIEGAIDIGDPSATQENVDKADRASNVAHKEVRTNGYGYVGINPRFVPNITVRRAIMKAMDTSIIFNNYYKNGLAEPINRPMSTVNWAYPKGCTVYKDEELGLDYSFDKSAYDIEQMIIDEGYVKNSDGIYQKNIDGFGVDKLDYKFTIAGASNDHPAYAMFIDAMNRLNKIGFNIRVVTSQTALSDLATGKLTVWAAAWSSTIDPDMYQVYHKDSSASSVTNWGYPQIKQKKTTTYAQEWAIINELSELIDAGRETNEQEGPDGRIAIYHKALDKIMELAVEMPTYQRTDMTAYNKNVIDPKTVTPDSEITSYNGVFSRLWEVNYYL